MVIYETIPSELSISIDNHFIAMVNGSEWRQLRNASAGCSKSNTKICHI